MNTLAAVWAPWSWSGDDSGPPSQQLEHRDQQVQDCREEEQDKPCSFSSRPQSAPTPAKRPSTSMPLHQVPQPEGGGDIDDGTRLRLFKKTATKSSSTSDLPRKRISVLAGSPGGGSNIFVAARDGGGERGGFGDQASAASPDFRRLGPSDYRPAPLTGCDFNALPTEFLDGPRPVVVAADNSGGGSKFRPETLMARRRSSSGIKGKQDIRHDQQTKTKKRPATLRPSTVPATDSGRSTVSLGDNNGVGWLNASLLGRRSGDDSGVQIGTTGGIGDVDADDSDSGTIPIWKGIHRAPPSLSTQSSSSLRSTSTSLAGTLEMWTKRELAAAKRAVSCRPQRSRLCLALRAHDSTSAGMAAAQRSYRGAFVMSKMGDAKARSTWRPYSSRS